MRKSGGGETALVVAILVAAACLRAPITGVGSLVDQIGAEYHLSSTVAGFITTIPLIAFAVGSPLAGFVSARLGAGKTVLAGLGLLAAGLYVRSFLGVGGFFIGTALIGLGLAVGNVLLPSIIKLAFPLRVGVMTGLYATALTVLGGASPGLSVPLSRAGGLGWQGALFIWFPLVVVALLFWLPRRGLQIGRPTAGAGGPSLARSSLAWSVSVYMGLHSLIFYSFVAWLPAILQSKGISVGGSALFCSLYQWVGLPTNFALPVLAARVRDQRLLSALLAAFYAAGMVLLLLAGQGPLLIVAVLICGFCSGGCFSLAMCLFSLRTGDAAGTARLSGMAQSFGYALAAISPTLIGAIYDAVASWTIPLLFLLAMIGMLFLAGRRACAAGTV